ncbi:MAG: hypothetical protein IJX27_03435 [Clostridia bacterium]|nr:hypothetical protein [Clostridia bacterium]
MSKLLFEEGRSKGAEYRKDSLAIKIMLASFAVVFIALLVVCLLLKQYLVTIIPGACILITVVTFILSVFQDLQYLSVYEDKITHKKLFFVKAKDIELAPSQYKIEVKNSAPIFGYTVKFVFKNLQGEKILTYRAVSMHPSNLSEKKKQWEKDIFAIGCDIVNEQEVIKTR